MTTPTTTSTTTHLRMQAYASMITPTTTSTTMHQGMQAYAMTTPNRWLHLLLCLRLRATRCRHTHRRLCTKAYVLTTTPTTPTLRCFYSKHVYLLDGYCICSSVLAAYRMRCFRSNQRVNIRRRRIRAVWLKQKSVFLFYLHTKSILIAL